LKKDKGKFKGTEAEAKAFFEAGGGDCAFGVKVESPIASGSTVCPEARKILGSNATWEMEFGYRP